MDTLEIRVTKVILDYFSTQAKDVYVDDRELCGALGRNAGYFLSGHPYDSFEEGLDEISRQALGARKAAIKLGLAAKSVTMHDREQ